MPLSPAQGSAYLNRRLEYYDPMIVRRTLPSLPFDSGEAIYTPQDLPMGATTINQEQVSFVGETTEYTNDLSNVPFVEVAVGEDTVKVQYRTLGMKWTWMDVQKEMIANSNGQMFTDCIKEKEKALSRIFMEFGNRSAAYGNAAQGITGVLNEANVPRLDSNIDFGTGGASDNDIVDFFNEQITLVTDTQNLAGEANLVRIPKRLKIRISSVKPNDNYSIEDAIMKAHPNIRGFIPYNEGRFDQLEENLPTLYPPGTNRNLIWIHRLDQQCFYRRKTYRNRFDLDYRHGVYEVVYVQGFAQVQYVEPLSSRYVTYPNFTIN